MPGRVVASITGKRKRDSADKKQKRKARSESSDEDRQAQILLLENQIFESRKNYNNISTLIKALDNVENESEEVTITAISLCRIFSRFMISGQLAKTKETAPKDAVVVQWLRDRYNEYKKCLLHLLRSLHSDSTFLTLCMRLIKTEGEHLRIDRQYHFPIEFLTVILRTLLAPTMESDVLREFGSKYVEEYDDIRYYTFECIRQIISSSETSQSQVFLGRILDILSTIQSMPESNEELEDFYVPAPKKSSHLLLSLNGHKKCAQETWLAIMRLDIDEERRNIILEKMTTSIVPWFTKPELLMDFLTDSYDQGGPTSLLALSGVFSLIQERNLDYPSFYPKLYSLLDRNMLHSRHRSKFFRLLDTFLASTHLPAALVASFIKRLSRLAIYSPPAAIVAVVPWIYNLLKKHPACTFMIHRETLLAEEKQELEEQGLDDPFVMDEADPMETRAMDSSLWELVMLQTHYSPNVATLAKVLSEQFTKPSYNLEDFLDYSYSNLLEAELSKQVKKVPVVEYEIPKKIFVAQDPTSGIEDSLLVKFWDFT